jgi:hypothetical protein
MVLSANTTVTPDASPTNATSMNVSTSTNFKGTLEANPTTGVVRVTDAHPAGTYTVTVRAFDSDGTSTTGTFALTVTTPVMCNALSFAAPTSFDAGTSPSTIVVGDFNGDGKQDLAVINDFTNNVSHVSILLGDGEGSFSAPTHVLSPVEASSIAVGDFNGDGRQDLVTVYFYADDVSIFLGDGAGNFSAPTHLHLGYNTHASVAVGDFNGDGKQDLVVLSQGDVAIFSGDGAGSFSTPTHVNVGYAYSSIAVGDFNGDGKQDLVDTNVFPYGVSIVLGDGTGSFSVPIFFSLQPYPFHVTVSDFNGDGRQDLAVARFSNNLGGVSILLGDGLGHFAGPVPVGSGDRPSALAVGDFNGDNKEDLAVSYETSNNVSILLGDGTGHFADPVPFGAGDPGSLAVGDFNNDGRQDLAVTKYNSDSVSILLNNCAGPEQCTVCHKHTTTITLPCNSMEYRRHLDHGDSVGACPSVAGRND